MSTDFDDERGRPDGQRPGTRADLMEAVDQLSRRLSAALVIAGALIAFGIYSTREEEQTYQAFAVGGEVFRLNTDSGTIIACNGTRCMRVLESGQALEKDQGNSLFKQAPTQPVAQPAPQLPAPAKPQAAPALPAPQQPVEAR